jgi:hypothetical protein
VQDKLIELTDDIGAHLEYFQELDQATRMLNHPGEQLIYQGDFLYMVEKVDICIEFLRARVRIVYVRYRSWTDDHSFSDTTKNQRSISSAFTNA